MLSLKHRRWMLLDYWRTIPTRRRENGRPPSFRGPWIIAVRSGSRPLPVQCRMRWLLMRQLHHIGHSIHYYSCHLTMIKTNHLWRVTCPEEVLNQEPWIKEVGDCVTAPVSSCPSVPITEEILPAPTEESDEETDKTSFADNLKLPSGKRACKSALS